MTTQQPRVARVYLTRINPWSVAKAAFTLAIALAIIIVIAMTLLWIVLAISGVFGAVARNVNQIVGNATTTFDFTSVIAYTRVLGVTLVICSVEIVAFTGLAGLFAVMYNATVSFTGGVEIEMSDS